MMEEWNGGIMSFGTVGCFENSLFEINIPIFHHFYPVKLFSISPGPWKHHRQEPLKDL